MSFLYREHRGSFEESMKTARKIGNVSELGDVEIQDYGYDKRLNSETKIVLNQGKPIGFLTEVKENEF